MSEEQKGSGRKENGVLQKSMENAKVVHLDRINLNRVKTMMQGCEAGRECLDFLDREKCEVVSEEVKGKAALNIEKKKNYLVSFSFRRIRRFDPDRGGVPVAELSG